MPTPTKIKRIDYNKRIDSRIAEEMAHWGKIMGSLEMVPYIEGKGWAGNIGGRERDVIWVTPSGGVIDDIQAPDLVGITQRENKICYFGESNKKPTSEWEIYQTIFDQRPDITAVLHGHDFFALETAEKLKQENHKVVGLTAEVTEAGSPEFRDEIAAVLTGDTNYLIGREHGFFALGRTFDEAGQVSLKFRSQAGRCLIGNERYQAIRAKYHML